MAEVNANTTLQWRRSPWISVDSWTRSMSRKNKGLQGWEKWETVSHFNPLIRSSFFMCLNVAAWSDVSNYSSSSVSCFVPPPASWLLVYCPQPCGSFPPLKQLPAHARQSRANVSCRSWWRSKRLKPEWISYYCFIHQVVMQSRVQGQFLLLQSDRKSQLLLVWVTKCSLALETSKQTCLSSQFMNLWK